MKNKKRPPHSNSSGVSPTGEPLPAGERGGRKEERGEKKRVRGDLKQDNKFGVKFV